MSVALLASCKKGGVFCHKEDGNIITQDRSVSAFSEVALSDIGNVYVEQSWSKKSERKKEKTEENNSYASAFPRKETIGNRQQVKEVN